MSNDGFAPREDYGEVVMRDLQVVRREMLDAESLPSLSALIAQQTLLLILREDAVFKKFADADMHAELVKLLADVGEAIDTKMRDRW